MCRIVSYLGDPVRLDHLIEKPDNALVHQAVNPQFMAHYKNLSGCGFIAWDDNHPNDPVFFKSRNPPFYDHNFSNLSRRISGHCTIAHIRGGSLADNVVVTDANAHPFWFPDAPVAMAHNGNLACLHLLKAALTRAIAPHWLACMRGTTDSEWIYALLLTQLCQTDHATQHTPKAIASAAKRTLEIIATMREAANIRVASPMNLFISNGQCLVITRFVYDFGCYGKELMPAHLQYKSLWYTYGSKYLTKDQRYTMQVGTPKALIVASEPLTTDTTRWVEVPEYSIITASRHAKNHKLTWQMDDIAL